MRSLEDAISQFVYHPATPDTAPKHAAVRDKLVDFVVDTWDYIPDGPEKTLALRGLQQFGMYANLAIALSAPADVSETRKVARELPPLATGGYITINPPAGRTADELADEIARQARIIGRGPA